MGILPCLDAGLLVGADQVDSLVVETGCLGIVVADRLDCGIERCWVFFPFIREPGADQMRFELGRALKHAPRSVGRWTRRCRA